MRRAAAAWVQRECGPCRPELDRLRGLPHRPVPVVGAFGASVLVAALGNAVVMAGRRWKVRPSGSPSWASLRSASLGWRCCRVAAGASETSASNGPGPGVLALVLLWGRLRSRSIVAPAAFHSAPNMAEFLPRV